MKWGGERRTERLTMSLLQYSQVVGFHGYVDSGLPTPDSRTFSQSRLISISHPEDGFTCIQVVDERPFPLFVFVL